MWKSLFSLPRIYSCNLSKEPLEKSPFLGIFSPHVSCVTFMDINPYNKRILKLFVTLKWIQFSFKFVGVVFIYRWNNTGCPKSLFLYFICLYFSTIRLGKQIIKTKFVFQSNWPFSYLLCKFFDSNIRFVHFRAKGAHALVYFPATYFLYSIARIARTPSLFFLRIPRKINPFNATTFSYFKGRACIFWFTGLSVVETAKKLEKSECWMVKWSWRNEGKKWRGRPKLPHKAAKQF